MGATNHGTQRITCQYYMESTGANHGRRNLDIVPVGVYSGGYLTKVSDTQVTMSPVVAEISDGTNQVSVRTTVAATLSSATLDSGSISSGTPYLVLRWAYTTSTANYMEIHAVASLSVLQENDLVLGKCTFVGATLSSFDYSERTFPRIMDQNLRVEATPDAELYVRLRGGRFNNGITSLQIGDQKVGPFAVPAGGNSRIDLVYIGLDGAVGILQGTAASSPSAPAYVGKLVLAEVRLVNGDTNITWNRITDARSLFQHPALIDEASLGLDSSGRMYVVQDALVPGWDVSIADANNLTLPSQFATTIAAFKDPSFGSIMHSHSGLGTHDIWMSNNSIRFRMGIRATGAITKALKLFAVDDNVYVYIDEGLVYSKVGAFSSANSPVNVNLVLSAGNHIIDVVFNDQGGSGFLSLLGTIVDNTTVYYRKL